MRVLGASLAVVIAVAVDTAPAAADGYSLHVTANVRNGWTDNLLNGESSESTPPKQADFYTQLMPGLLGTWEKPRLVQELFYEAEANLYLEADEGASLSHRAGWRAFFVVSPLTEVSTSVQGSAGVLNTFNTWGQAQTGEPVFLPSTESRFAMLEARQLLTRSLSRSVRINQSAVARAFTATPEGAAEGSTGYEIGAGGGVDKAWDWNALGVSATFTYSVLGANLDQPDNSVHGGITGQWRRDLGEHWTTNLDIGVTGVIPVDPEDQFTWGPTAGAMLSYTEDWGAAGLSARRTIAPNLFLQANTISDVAVVHAYLPLPWLRDRLRQPRLTFGASGGIGRTAIVDNTGTEVANYGLYFADVGLGYQIRDQMTAGLRYQFIAQEVDDDAMSVAIPNMNSYQRNTVMLTFYARWPSRVAGEVPTRVGLRVDRSDDNPTGDDAASTGGGPDGTPGGADRR